MNEQKIERILEYVCDTKCKHPEQTSGILPLYCEKCELEKLVRDLNEENKGTEEC